MNHLVSSTKQLLILKHIPQLVPDVYHIIESFLLHYKTVILYDYGFRTTWKKMDVFFGWLSSDSDDVYLSITIKTDYWFKLIKIIHKQELYFPYYFTPQDRLDLFNLIIKLLNYFDDKLDLTVYRLILAKYQSMFYRLDEVGGGPIWINDYT